MSAGQNAEVLTDLEADDDLRLILELDLIRGGKER
jgi:hypothetical protein